MVSAERMTDKFQQLDEFLAILKGMRKTPLTKFLNDKIIIGGAKYYLQVSIECCLDVANHIIASEGFRAPRSHCVAGAGANAKRQARDRVHRRRSHGSTGPASGERWRVQHGGLATVRGAVLLFPLLYDDIEPGLEPVYDAVVQRACLNIVFLQPQAAAVFWRRERLKAALESAGGKVKLTFLAGLRDGYYRRPDASPEELAAGDKLGELLLTQIKALPKGSTK